MKTYRFLFFKRFLKFAGKVYNKNSFLKLNPVINVRIKSVVENESDWQ